jgi:hypothetical protein
MCAVGRTKNSCGAMKILGQVKFFMAQQGIGVLMHTLNFGVA